MTEKKIKDVNKTLLIEEIQKRVNVSQEQLDAFLTLWEFKKFKKNEFILNSIFVLKGCLRQI